MVDSLRWNAIHSRNPMFSQKEIQVFWDVTLCLWVNTFWRFEWSWCLHLHRPCTGQPWRLRHYNPSKRLQLLPVDTAYPRSVSANICTNLRTRQSTHLCNTTDQIPFDNLIIPPLVNKFPVSLETWFFSRIYCTPPHFISFRSILILSSHIRLGLRSVLIVRFSLHFSFLPWKDDTVLIDSSSLIWSTQFGVP